MRNYLTKTLNKNKTPQREPIPGSKQLANSAGGFAWAVDDFTRLNRFLILGSEGGSYYAAERALTAENAEAVIRAIKSDGPRAVREIVAVSHEGRAPKNDPALFALAVAMIHGDLPTRQAAYTAIPRVARIGTHLFHLLEYVSQMKKGWGRGLKTAVAGWYLDRPAAALATQVVKYGRRDGWSHLDVLRLTHPKAKDDVQNTIFNYVRDGWPNVGEAPHDVEALQVIWAAERVKADIPEKELVRLIGAYDLPMEVIPTEKRSRAVYELMLPHAGLTWLIRNLANLTRTEVLKTGQYANLNIVTRRLVDEAQIKKQRVHPIHILGAMAAYKTGRSKQVDDAGRVRKVTAWEPVQKIVDTLNEAFYLSFKHVEPTGRRYLLGLDVSGSMAYGAIAGMPGVTPCMGAAAMSMVAARTEPKTVTMGFTSTFTDLGISPKDDLAAAMEKAQQRNFGPTDCATPMIWALKHRVEVDVFSIYTDTETWAGVIHPVQALKEYRQRMGIAAKLIVVGMVSNGFTIADPDDAGMLDVVGFDTSAPAVMAEFAKT